MRIYQVDAFTDRTFSGNPAGVCIIDSFDDEELMQNIAAEMNLSETAFLKAKTDGFDLRWFTPEREVDLCGHATLASAHILWETGILKEEEEARFHTKSGLLTSEKKDDFIELNFPKEEDHECQPPAGLAAALNVDLKYVGKNRMDYIVEVESERMVTDLRPSFELLKKIDTRGVMVTSASENSAYDFVSRFFAPAYGVNEDPVTGSAHCCLGPYWSRKTGKNEMTAYQASKRGGLLRVRVGADRVYLGGQALTVFSADLIIRY